MRTQWLHRTLFADITGFRSDWSDPQLQQSDASGLGAYFDNVGGARSQGIELALRWLTPLPGLMASFNGAYVDTVTTKAFTTSSGEQTQPGTRWPLAAKLQTATTLAWQRASSVESSLNSDAPSSFFQGRIFTWSVGTLLLI